MDVRELTPEGQKAIATLLLYYRKGQEEDTIRGTMRTVTSKLDLSEEDPKRKAYDKLMLNLKRIAMENGVTAIELSRLFPDIFDFFAIEHSYLRGKLMGQKVDLTVDQALKNYRQALQDIKPRETLRQRFGRWRALRRQKSLAAENGQPTGSRVDCFFDWLLR